MFQNFVYAFVILLVAAAGAYFGAFAKERGKNWATKADFDDLLNQLKTNTRSVEEIKSEIHQADWTAREWNTIQRIKLEELLTAVIGQCAYMEDLRSYHFFNNPEPTNHQLLEKIDMLSKLYFPEMDQTVTEFVAKCRELMIIVYEASNKILATKNHQEKMAAIKEQGEIFRDAYRPVLSLMNQLTALAASHLKSIMQKK
ncbi:MAG TPA: hypothetical protein VFR09_04690 [Alphaproteobacteria bacterium]|nr:hypothetical protein [Alphaproteobacteria bacterium]